MQKNHNISPFKPKLKLVSRYTIFSGLDKTSYKASAPPFVFFPRKENLSCPQSDHPYPYPKKERPILLPLSPHKKGDFSLLPPHHNSSRIVTHWKKEAEEGNLRNDFPKCLLSPPPKKGERNKHPFFFRGTSYVFPYNWQGGNYEWPAGKTPPKEFSFFFFPSPRINY